MNHLAWLLVLAFLAQWFALASFALVIYIGVLLFSGRMIK